MKRPDGWSRTEWGLLIAIGYVALVVIAKWAATLAG